MKFILPFLLLPILGIGSQDYSLPSLPLAFSYDASELLAPLTTSDQELIRSKLVRLFGAQHLIGAASGQAFSIHPRFDILEAYDGQGMRPSRFLKAEFSISLREVASSINLGSYQWTLIGSGSNDRAALMAALRKIPRSDDGLLSFLRGIRPQLEQYYLANCSAIIAKADRMIMAGEYDKAIVQLMNIPTEASACSQKASEKLQAAYDEFQRIHCGPLLQEARAAMAGRKFTKALDLLLLISPNSVCGEDANAMMDEIGRVKNQLSERKFVFAQTLHQQQLDQQRFNQQLSLQRWVTVSEIAKAIGGVAGIFSPGIDFNIKLQ